ncbi:acyl-CoA desaturase, partial [Candidatus Woesearchaeota archaeon]
YHRLYAHKSYKANKVVEVLILWFATMASQGSALGWAADHRKHHQYVDTARDPYSIKRGFWHAHMFWFMKRRPPYDFGKVPDLMRNKLLRFQHEYYAWLVVGTNSVATLAVWALTGDLAGAFIISWWTRLFFTHHATFFINSLAHTWGAKPYAREQTAVDNYLMAFLTFGEGYHNYHHSFPNDYRNGVRWWHFDPTKWLIWLLAQAGLATDLRRIDTWVAKRRALIEDKNALLKQLHTRARARKAALERALEAAARRYTVRVVKLRQAIATWQQTRKRQAKERIRLHRRALRAEWRHWKRLVRAVRTIPAA